MCNESRLKVGSGRSRPKCQSELRKAADQFKGPQEDGTQVSTHDSFSARTPVILSYNGWIAEALLQPQRAPQKTQ